MNDGIKISEDVFQMFERMTSEISDIQVRALQSGAYMLKDKIKETFASKMPTATKPVRTQTGNGGYKITSNEPLVEAIRQTKTRNGSVTVHALGSGASGSSTFIARFYEQNTQPRYNKTRHGIKLKKHRLTGNTTGVKFFEDAINSYSTEVTEHISRVIKNKLSAELQT